MKSLLVILLSFTFASMAYAGPKSPQFNKDRKMKANEVFKKCGEWAKKETEKMKADTVPEKRAKSDEFEKLANSCSLNNGFDAKGK